MYALGALEGEEAEAIRRHLRQGCETCLEGLRQGTAFWASYGTAQAGASLQAPPSRVRRRLLSEISPSRAGGWWLGWKQGAGLAALVVATGAGAWWLARQTVQPKTRVVTQVTADPRQQEEIAQLRRQLEEAQKQRPDGPEPVPPSPNKALERDLDQAKLAAAEAGRALEAERARIGQLEAEIQDKAKLLEAAGRQLRETEKRLVALTEERAKGAADRDRQFASFQARIRELERENAQVRGVLAAQEKQLQQSLRLANFLGSPSLEFVKLRATGTGAGAEGHAFLAEGSRMVFYASNLPPLAAGRTYQLWLIRGTGPAVVSGGVFKMAGGRQVIEFADPGLVRSIRGLAVTDEPEGGSPKPTGAKFLVGSAS